ncbi:hypothetical protein [Psychromonas sp. SP041]|uniref:hypothetical protein n=1 Tax=Psychromonas sp. SP041 TaxID=1365007 RepID=UPI0010C7DD10|nr:hypothetical protein [Psychromonas sp. SP041]
MYSPIYKRFQFDLHMAFEKKKFYRRKLDEISKVEWYAHRLMSLCGAISDKVAEEHFDFILGGADCLLSLCEAILLQEKGYRVLVYPFNERDEKINLLLRGYSELESAKLINYVYREILKHKQPESVDIVALVDELSNLIKNRTKSGVNYGQVLFVIGQKYVIDKDWTSFYKNKPMFSLKNGESSSMEGLWTIPLIECEGFTQCQHRAEDGYFGVSDTCIITFDSLILNTRPDFNMNIDHQAHSVTCFGDAKNQIDKRNICTVLDRIKDLSEVIYYLSTKLPGEQYVR